MIDIAVQNGFGKHEWDIPRQNKREALKVGLILSSSYYYYMSLAANIESLYV